ncbi:uncharacterized protein TRIADDRAFT_56108 [Trichoplax adhaerens]|uniref:ALMS motif domain-containing protein n=1 Tax=Trichoplax adhaerens TaxID=10228 RepID=B3RX75_TRIAD|nr:predicted protein [Trichoplax adhaerens]EDV24367.1 predicted protein [Trichoplax adhaerens]|eukprot:XP_002112257.1 predicted protein [Trichoplax adhaerens]
MKERLMEQQEERKRISDKAKEKQIFRENNKRRKQYEQQKMKKLKKEAEERERLLASRRRKIGQEVNKMRSVVRQQDDESENKGGRITPNLMIKRDIQSNKRKNNSAHDKILSYYESSGLTRQDIILGGNESPINDDYDALAYTDESNNVPKYQSTTIRPETSKPRGNSTQHKKDAFINQIDEINKVAEMDSNRQQLDTDDELSSADSLEIGRVSIREGKCTSIKTKPEIHSQPSMESGHGSALHKSNSNNLLANVIDDDDDELFDSLDLTPFQLLRHQNSPNHQESVKIPSQSSSIRPLSAHHRQIDAPIHDTQGEHSRKENEISTKLSDDDHRRRGQNINKDVDSELPQTGYSNTQNQQNFTDSEPNLNLQESKSSLIFPLHDDDDLHTVSQTGEDTGTKKDRISSAKSTKSVRFADTASYHGLSDVSSLSDDFDATVSVIVDEINKLQLSNERNQQQDDDHGKHYQKKINYHQRNTAKESGRISSSKQPSQDGYDEEDDKSSNNDDSVDPWKLSQTSTSSQYQNEEIVDVQSQLNQSSISPRQYQERPKQPIERSRSEGSLQGKIKSNHSFKSLAAVEDPTNDNVPTEDEVSWLWNKVQQCLEIPSGTKSENKKKKDDDKSRNLLRNTGLNISKRIMPSDKIRRSSVTSAQSDTVLLKDQDSASSRIPRKVSSAKPSTSAKIRLRTRSLVKQPINLKHTKPYPNSVKAMSKTRVEGNSFNRTIPRSSTYGPVRSSANKSLEKADFNTLYEANNVSESVAHFIMAESLCKKSLSESQIEDLLKAKNAPKKKQVKPSALSIEEKRLLASIQRLDAKLEETTAANAELIRKHLAGVETFKPQLRKRISKATQPIRPQQFYEMNVALKANKQQQKIKSRNTRVEDGFHQNRTVRL